MNIKVAVNYLYLPFFFLQLEDELAGKNGGKNGCSVSRGCMVTTSSSQPDVRVRIPLELENENSRFENHLLFDNDGRPQQVMSKEVLQKRFTNQRKAVRIDEFCRFIFPLGFIIFNVCYWNYYQSDFEEESL